MFFWNTEHCIRNQFCSKDNCIIFLYLYGNKLFYIKKIRIFSGCLPLLIQLLHGSDKDSGLLGNTRGSKAARERAAAALHNIVHSHPDDKRGRREARVLRFLEQIRAHCDQLREIQEDSPEMSGEKWGSLRGKFSRQLFFLFLWNY